MNRTFGRFFGLQCKIGAALLASAASGWAGNFSTDFNSGQPGGTSLWGYTYVDSFGGVGDSGALKLTDAFGGLAGSMVLDDIDGGNLINSFVAEFSMLIGGGNQADGLSFNFAPDLPDGFFAEEGGGTGISVCFDTYDNGGGEAPAIDLKNGGATLVSAKGIIDLFRTGDWVPVRIEAHANSTVTVIVNGVTVFDNVFGGFTASQGRFGLGARTGGLWDNHWIDNLTITTSAGLPEHPTVLSFGPTGEGAREDAVVRVAIRDGTKLVNPASIQLKFDGATVAPTITKASDVTTVSYDPPGLMVSASSHTVSVSLADTGATPFVQTVPFSFQVRYYVGPTGNIYDLIAVDGGITWEDANIAANSRTYHGRPGHLATLTSYDEDVFANKVRTTTLPGSSGWQVWVGGYQDYGVASTEGWHWVNNEGPISGVNGGSTYSNWRPGEPNDYFGPDSENYLGLGLNGEFVWNDDGYFGFRLLPGYVIEYEAPKVGIDIKPGAYPNVVNVEDNGKIPVAVLSSLGFNATKIDASAIRFGRTGVEAAPVSWSVKDVNGDGRADLLLNFNVQDTGWRCGDSAGILIGKDADGLPFKGQDTVQLNGCPEYGLSLFAVQDVNHNTDVQLRVTPLLPGYIAPTIANQAVFKSYKIAGPLGWTRTVNNIPLTIGVDGSSVGTVRFTDVLHFQKIDAKVNIPNSKNKNTEIIRADTRVLYRPDLAVGNVNAPASVNTFQLVNISAAVTETKGDLGATANASLLDGGVVIDSVNGLNVAAGGQIGIVFTARFTTAGTHSLKIVVGNVQPGDYDLSNNETSFDIDVIQPPLAPVPYSNSYSHYESDYYEEFDNDYATGVYHNYYNNESYVQQLQPPLALTFPMNLSFKLTVDGSQVADLAVSDIFGGGYDDVCFKYRAGYFQLDDSTSGYIETYRDDCSNWQQSYVTIQHYAYRNIYFSSQYYKYWEYGYIDSYDYGYGTFLNAANSIGFRTIVQAAEGKFGGDGGIPQLYNYSYDIPFDNEWDTGYDRGYSRYSNTYGDYSGITTP